MKINVFGKKMTTRDGKRDFVNYFGKLTKKDGSTITTTIKFREEVGTPSKTPITIEVNKNSCNFNQKEVLLEDGTTAINNTLWIAGEYTETDYIDDSMNDFI